MIHSVLKVKCCRLAVHSDVRHVTTGTDKFGAQFEAGRNADGLDGDVHAQTAREVLGTNATASSRPLLTIRSAPNRLAASSLASARSMAMIWLGE